LEKQRRRQRQHRCRNTMKNQKASLQDSPFDLGTCLVKVKP
jgi:hypothetical protein